MASRAIRVNQFKDNTGLIYMEVPYNIAAKNLLMHVEEWIKEFTLTFPSGQILVNVKNLPIEVVEDLKGRGTKLEPTPREIPRGYKHFQVPGVEANIRVTTAKSGRKTDHLLLEVGPVLLASQETIAAKVKSYLRKNGIEPQVCEWLTRG
jgi:hypothetical protein